MKKVIFYFILFGVFFIGFSSFNQDNNREELLGDVNEYVFSFEEVTIPNEKIVMFDNRGLDSIEYYVIEFYGTQYAVYHYYFLENKENYLNKYVEESSHIVDYNYDEFMIKTIEFVGDETYDEVMSLLENSLQSNALYIIY